MRRVSRSAKTCRVPRSLEAHRKAESALNDRLGGGKVM